MSSSTSSRHEKTIFCEPGDNIEYFETQLEQLRNRFRGKNVAIYNRRVVDVDESSEELMTRLVKNYRHEEIDSMCIRYIEVFEPPHKYAVSDASTFLFGPARI